MLTDDLVAVLASHGITAGAGVPCSYFTALVNRMATDPLLSYVGAAQEGDAVAIAAGMTAAGRPAFALMQNSGLGNAVSPVTSLLAPYGIPVVLLVSHRGEPGVPDEPQHELMGAITYQVAELCGLRTHSLDAELLDAQLSAALRDSVASAFICGKGALTGDHTVPPIVASTTTSALTPSTVGVFTAHDTREQVLTALLPHLNSGLDGSGVAPAVVSTTGKLSRELWELDDADGSRRNRFYMVGSMGCAAPFGLGVALVSERPVVVLDGDGALLMRLGALATIGEQAPSNLHHVVIDNGAHDSTGGQATSSPGIDLAAMALAAGYTHAETVDSADAAAEALGRHVSIPGPTFLRVMTTVGARSNLGRPHLRPRANYERFRAFLAEVPQ